MMDNVRDKSRLPATISISRPGDFPLGSVESRAAMRAMIERVKESGLRLRIILIGHPSSDCEGKVCRDVLIRGLGTCGLVTGELFVNEDGQVERTNKHGSA